MNTSVKIVQLDSISNTMGKEDLGLQNLMHCVIVYFAILNTATAYCTILLPLH